MLVEGQFNLHSAFTIVHLHLSVNITMSQPAITFTSLSAKLQQRIVFFLDMPTLRSLCYVSQEATQLVEEKLTQSLHTLLKPFTTHPQEFLRVLQNSGAIIGGDVAIAFMARDLRIIPTALTIYTPLDNPYPLEDFFDAQENMEGKKRCLPQLEDAMIWRSKLIKSQLIYHMGKSAYIFLYESCSPFPMASLASRAITSHFMTFVDGITYGTPYPALFFQRRALLGSPLFNQAIDTSSNISRHYMNTHHLKMELVDTQQGGNAWYDYHLSLNHTLELQQLSQDQ